MNASVPRGTAKVAFRRLVTLAKQFDCSPRTLRRRCERAGIAVYDTSCGKRPDYCIHAHDAERLSHPVERTIPARRADAVAHVERRLRFDELARNWTHK